MLSYLFSSLSRFPPPEKWASLVSLEGLYSTLLFGLFFVAAGCVRAFRFGFLLRRTANIAWRKVVTAFPWLFMIGAFTPFRLGEGARASWAQDNGGVASEALAYWFGERLADLMCLFLITALSFSMIPDLPKYASSMSVVFFWALIFGYVFLWLAHGRFANWAERVPILETMGLSLFFNTFSYMNDYKAHAILIASTFMIWILMTAGFFFAITTYLGAVPISGVSLTLGAVNLTNLVSVAPGNVGGYQSAAVGALSSFDIYEEDALLISILMNGTNMLLTLCFGVIGWVAQFSNKRQLRRPN